MNVSEEKGERAPRNSIQEAQISVVICGSSSQQWIAYAFVDNIWEAEDRPEDDASLCGDHGFCEDPLINNGSTDANRPLCDAREYFLAIVESRVRQVLKEWRYLVQTIERTIASKV